VSNTIVSCRKIVRPKNSRFKNQRMKGKAAIVNTLGWETNRRTRLNVVSTRLSSMSGLASVQIRHGTNHQRSFRTRLPRRSQDSKRGGDLTDRVLRRTLVESRSFTSRAILQPALCTKPLAYLRNRIATEYPASPTKNSAKSNTHMASIFEGCLSPMCS
jgi:hypothetical protein